jgi:hypothetical protein
LFLVGDSSTPFTSGASTITTYKNITHTKYAIGA